jgi:excisionase family DNA binding protein
MIAEQWSTVAEVAAWLKVKPGVIYALCKAGRLTHSRIGLGRGTIRINKKALDAYIAQGSQEGQRYRVTLKDLQAVAA